MHTLHGVVCGAKLLLALQLCSWSGCQPCAAPVLLAACRPKMVEVLKEKFADLNLTYSIGGQISFDVFPAVSSIPTAIFSCQSLFLQPSAPLLVIRHVQHQHKHAA